LAEPGVRLAMAKALGVAAASTAIERRDAAVGRAGLAATPATGKALRNLIEKAHRRRVETTALRIGDEVHVVQPLPEMEEALAASPLIHVHRIELRVPAIERLMSELRSWTEEDYAADPFLTGAIQAIDLQGADETAFEFARRCVLYAHAAPTPQKPPAGRDWQSVLARVVAGSPPEVEFTVAPPSGFGTFLLDASSCSAVPVPPVAGPYILRRAVPAVWRSLSDDSGGVGTLKPEFVDDSNRWLDLLDSYLGRPKLSEHPDSRPVQVRDKPVPLSPDWDSADEAVALVWLALGEALKHTAAVILHDGRVLLSLGSGVFARIAVRRRPYRRDAHVRVGLLMSPEDNGRDGRAPKFTSQVDVFARFGPDLPSRIVIARDEWLADVTFTGSALFAGMTMSYGGAEADDD
ncbi:MAG: hypothetical protein ACYCWW_19150, partial [Deltaproteobacteria bacterium]